MSGNNTPEICKCESYHTALKNAANDMALCKATISDLEKQINLLNLQIYNMAVINLHLTAELNAYKCKLNGENTSSNLHFYK